MERREPRSEDPHEEATSQSRVPEDRPRKSSGRRRWLALLVLVAHLLGLAASVDALMGTRTAQGAIAWIVSLNAFPLVAVPAYLVLGRHRFEGYVVVRQDLEELSAERIEQIRRDVRPYLRQDWEAGSGAIAGQNLARLPYLTGNAVELLIDGQATFDSIFAGIDGASDYILVQFYIVRDDRLGSQLKERLIAKARAGVDVWFLYDEI